MCPYNAQSQSKNDVPKNKTIKSDRVFYSLAYYDLFENNISGSFLEKLTASSYGFGDKSITRDVILRQLIFSKSDNSLLDSLNQYKELSILDYFPALSDNILERPYLLINFYLINELLKFKSDNFFENIGILVPKLKAHLSTNDSDDLEDDNTENDEIKENIISYIDAINWAIHTDNKEFFIEYFNKEWRNYRLEHPLGSASDLFNLKRKQGNEMYPIIDYFLPIPLSTCIKEYGRQNNVIPTSEMVTKDPSMFIIETYHKLLGREPGYEEKAALLPLFEGPSPLDPGMLYYLIMSSEEYLYY